jgi:hypothetical protein
MRPGTESGGSHTARPMTEGDGAEDLVPLKGESTGRGARRDTGGEGDGLIDCAGIGRRGERDGGRGRREVVEEDAVVASVGSDEG